MQFRGLMHIKMGTQNQNDYLSDKRYTIQIYDGIVCRQYACIKRTFLCEIDAVAVIIMKGIWEQRTDRSKNACLFIPLSE